MPEQSKNKKVQQDTDVERLLKGLRNLRQMNQKVRNGTVELGMILLRSSEEIANSPSLDNPGGATLKKQ